MQSLFFILSRSDRSGHTSVMQIRIHTHGEQNIAELVSDAILIKSAQDALDVMHDPDLGGARSIILRRDCLHPDFFLLETGLAGDIAQKFVNYGVRLAIVGEFSDARPALQAFIRESNRGRHVFFCESVDVAKGLLSAR
jgi:hypothetical protein